MGTKEIKLETTPCIYCGRPVDVPVVKWTGKFVCEYCRVVELKIVEDMDSIVKYWYDDFRRAMRVKTVKELKVELKTLDDMESIASTAIKAAKTSLAAIDKSTSAIPALHVIEGMEANNAITRRKVLWLLTEIDVRQPDND